MRRIGNIPRSSTPTGYDSRVAIRLPPETHMTPIDAIYTLKRSTTTHPDLAPFTIWASFTLALLWRVRISGPGVVGHNITARRILDCVY